MRIVVQRVSEASVTVEGAVTGAINTGLLVLLGIEDQIQMKISTGSATRSETCVFLMIVTAS